MYIHIHIPTNIYTYMYIYGWKEGMERKGLCVNMGKTKVMKCQRSSVLAEDSGRWPCGVSRCG